MSFLVCTIEMTSYCIDFSRNKDLQNNGRKNKPIAGRTRSALLSPIPQIKMLKSLIFQKQSHGDIASSPLDVSALSHKMATVSPDETCCIPLLFETVFLAGVMIIKEPNEVLLSPSKVVRCDRHHYGK